MNPSKGRLEVDEINIHSNLASWHKKIGYVPQSIYLLDDTIKKNIAFGLEDKDINDNLVKQAVEKANLNKLVEKLPNGMDTIVGEKGTIILDLPYCNLPGETSTVTIITESNYKKIDTTAFGDSMRKNFSTINFDEIAYDYQVDSVNSTILKGTKPTITLEDSRNNIKTIMALLKSSKKNSFISL